MKTYLKIRILFLYLLSFNFCFTQINFENQGNLYGLDFSTGTTFLGSGVSFVDYDNDGWDDLTFASGNNQSIRFFKNFTGFFVEQFYNIPTMDYPTKSITWVDFDNDGDKDLFVTSFNNGNKLLQNDGDFNFLDITTTANLPTENIYSYGASWGDIDNDGFLDIFISSFDSNRLIPNLLFKNNRDGTFTNVSESANISSSGHLSFCSAFIDYNKDGWQDIYISNDRALNTNILYKNNGDGTFTDVSQESGAGIAIDAMSVTVGDFNSDGWFDIYVTNTPTLGNYFLKNNGDGTFTNIAEDTETQVFGTCWGAVFIDAENDSDLDIYASSAVFGDSPFNSSMFFRNIGNETFVTSTTNFYGFVDDDKESYSNATGDVDNDGLLDIIVNNSNNQKVDFWKNNTSTVNNWLKINLEGTSSNKDGVGSVIEISVNGNTQYSYAVCGEGYLSQSSFTETLGIGNNLVVDYVKIKWLSGVEDILFNVNANQILNIVEGSTSTTLSSNLYNNDFTLKVYPNPVQNDILYLSSDNTSNLFLERIELYDLLGNLIFSSESNISEIDFSNFKSGTYVLKTNFRNSNKIEHFKVLKY